MALFKPIIFSAIQECDKVYRGNMTVKLKNYDAYISVRFQFNDKEMRGVS